MAAPGTPIIGIAGWKNSGKTTLVVKLVEELTRHGLRVATVKHAHHDFEIDGGETDSARHRRAGASEVAIVGGDRWAIVSELRGAPEPSLPDIVARLSPADLIVVEGYKAAPIPKIEARRKASAEKRPLAATDPNVIAIAADHDVGDAPVPVFDLNDAAAIARFIAAWLKLQTRGTP